MAEQNDLTSALLEMSLLLRRYNMMWYGKNYGGLDPRQGQGRILTALRRMKRATQKELGFILDMRPQSLGELLQKLENSGYIRRTRSTDDKRVLVVELTEEGEHFQLQKPNYDELFIDLSFREKKVLQESLEKISMQLKTQIEKEHEDNFF
ncbi:MAG: MarR family transcriptional regulator [Selenomonadaceae bacterium]|nr:MarR family transcriptional regulator [Selenomonadaceae bacterium]